MILCFVVQGSLQSLWLQLSWQLCAPASSKNRSRGQPGGEHYVEALASITILQQLVKCVGVGQLNVGLMMKIDHLDVVQHG